MSDKGISILQHFDSLARLAQQQPEAFENRRRQLIEQMIAAQPPERQENLRRLQWRIDQENRSTDTSLARCIRVSEMMWERFNAMREKIELICDIYDGKTVMPVEDEKAKIISLKTISA